MKKLLLVAMACLTLTGCKNKTESILTESQQTIVKRLEESVKNYISTEIRKNEDGTITVEIYYQEKNIYGTRLICDVYILDGNGLKQVK